MQGFYYTFSDQEFSRDYNEVKVEVYETPCYQR